MTTRATTADLKWKKCKGSGDYQMLDWENDDKGYPGACVCIYCSYGVLVVRGTVSNSVSKAGREGLAGKLRVHYVDKRTEQMKYAREPKGITE